MEKAAKIFIFSGVIIIFIGIVMLVFAKLNIPFLGRLPGDILIKKKNFVFYFPLTSALLISAAITLIFSLIKFFHK